MLPLLQMYATLTTSRKLQVFGGRSITTFKLHLAAVHLADQVRACGAGFFSTEYWVERMVQLLKRMIKYRSTAYPELLFVHDWLLVLACRRVRRTVEGKDLETLEEALESIRAAKRKVHDQPDAAGSYLAGAAKEVEEEEKTKVLPPYEAPAGILDVVEPAGLPLLLHTDPALASEGWPTFPGDPPGTRADWIYSELGLGGPMEAEQPVDEDPCTWVQLRKFLRARLPVDESVCCTQWKAQRKKNNQWGLVIWKVQGGMGEQEDELCAIQFQYFVQACFKTKDLTDRASQGLGILHLGHVPAKASTLKLAVATVFKCVSVQGPGMRPLSERTPQQVAEELPELLKLGNTSPSPTNPAFCGTWVLDLRSINSQLVPTKDRNGKRSFMNVSRASGRTTAVKR